MQMADIPSNLHRKSDVLGLLLKQRAGLQFGHKTLGWQTLMADLQVPEQICGSCWKAACLESKGRAMLPEPGKSSPASSPRGQHHEHLRTQSKSWHLYSSGSKRLIYQSKPDNDTLSRKHTAPEPESTPKPGTEHESDSDSESEGQLTPESESEPESDLEQRVPLDHYASHN